MTVSAHPWLKNAVFYEIFPASFADSNSDGIGDIPGIISHLDYLAELGITGLWLNPIYDSPFRDGGYDVRNYTQVAARYGTEADVKQLLSEAHDRGIHILLDLIPGHTSDEHPWFTASAEASPNDYSERFIWTDSWISGSDGQSFVGGVAPRDGTYITNFFAFQPALNYGYAHPNRGWQKPAGGADSLETEAAIVDVMRFWLSLGVDGFRVDMADSLVKNDDYGKPFTRAVWKRMFATIRAEFPDAVFVSEWGRPEESFDAGFDMDFYLDWRWDGIPNGYNMLLRNCPSPLSRQDDCSYFNADSPVGIQQFLHEYLPRLDSAHQNDCLFNLITCNHDTARLAPRLTPREIQLAYATILTLPGAPFVYYGDEIGMRYRSLPTKEGAYTRTGSRTPMQWDASKPNCGFSSAAPDALYLPLDTDNTNDPSAGSVPEELTVAGQNHQPESLWNTVREIIRLRNTMACLDGDANFDVVYASETERSFIFKRTGLGEHANESVIIAVNPSRDVETHALAPAGEGTEPSDSDLLTAMAEGFGGDHADDSAAQSDDATVLMHIGDVSVNAGLITLGPQSFAIVVVR